MIFSPCLMCLFTVYIAYLSPIHFIYILCNSIYASKAIFIHVRNIFCPPVPWNVSNSQKIAFHTRWRPDSCGLRMARMKDDVQSSPAGCVPALHCFLCPRPSGPQWSQPWLHLCPQKLLFKWVMSSQDGISHQTGRRGPVFTCVLSEVPLLLPQASPILHPLNMLARLPPNTTSFQELRLGELRLVTWPAQGHQLIKGEMDSAQGTRLQTQNAFVLALKVTQCTHPIKVSISCENGDGGSACAQTWLSTECGNTRQAVGAQEAHSECSDTRQAVGAQEAHSECSDTCQAVGTQAAHSNAALWVSL